jgi:tetratricopeptide (TPR) repeat protein
LTNVRSGYKRHKYLGLGLLILLLSLFSFHKFFPPELSSLNAGSIKVAYQENRSLCSAKAKAAYKDSVQDQLVIKSYCGVFGSWKEDETKKIPMRYLETEFARLKAPAYIIQAGALIKSKNYTAAIASLENSLFLEPNNDHAYTLLSFSHYLNGEKRLAMQSIQKALSINPNSAEAHNAVALLYKDENKNDEAYRHFQKSALLKPNAASYIALGQMELLLNKPAEAREHFEKSLYEDQNNTAALTQLGLLYWQEHSYDKAAKVLEKAYRVNSSNPGIFLNYYEISLVTQTSLSTQEQDAFIENSKDNKTKMMAFDMLRIIKRSIQKEDTDLALEQWKATYSGEKLDWSFKELLSWLDESSLNDDEKHNVKQVVGFFIGYQQLYNLEHQAL